MSFACIVFVLIGVPLGIIARNGSMAVGVTYSIFFFVLYWVFLIAGENLADRLIVPPVLTMWMCNIVIGIFGLFLTLRMVRETPIIRYDPLIRLWQRIVHPKRRFKLNRGIITILFKRFPAFCINKIFGTLQGYLIRKFIGYSVTVFAALIVIFVILDYISSMRSLQTAAFIDVVYYYWYYLAWFIGLIFPIGFLLSSMFAMASLAKNNELTAIKAAGVGFRKLTFPLLIIGVFLSFFSFYLSEKILPVANARKKELFDDIKAGISREERKKKKIQSPRELKPDFYYFLNDKTVYRFREFRAEPALSEGVLRTRVTSNKVKEYIMADRMENNGRKWLFIKGYRRLFCDDSVVCKYFDTLADSLMNTTPEEMSAQLTRTSADYLSYWELQALIEKVKKVGEKVSGYRADLNFKIALPFMNFVVILLGLSITGRVGKKGSAIAFGVGLGLAFTYWVFSQILLSFGKSEIINPVLAAWAGNVVFFIVGVFLYKKASS